MTDTPKAILLAACRVIDRDGAARLTLDAVAREAGVSKGGLLYHYPNKDALLKAAVDAYLTDFETDLQRRENLDPNATGRFTRANFASNLAVAPQPDASAALLAAMLLDPALLVPVRERYGAWRTCAEDDGLEPGLGTLLSLAVDGLWLADLLDLGAPNAERREQLHRVVLKLTGGAS